MAYQFGAYAANDPLPSPRLDCKHYRLEANGSVPTKETMKTRS